MFNSSLALTDLDGSEGSDGSEAGDGVYEVDEPLAGLPDEPVEPADDGVAPWASAAQPPSPSHTPRSKALLPLLVPASGAVGTALSYIGSAGFRLDLQLALASSAVGLSAACLTRFLIHLKQRYFVMRPSRTDNPAASRRARRWVTAEGVVVAVMVAVASALIAYPRPLLAGLFDLTAVFVFGLLSMALVDAAEAAGLDRGSEFEICRNAMARLSKILQRGAPLSWVRVFERFPLNTPATQVSAFVVVITLGLGGLAGAELSLAAGNRVQSIVESVENSLKPKPSATPTPTSLVVATASAHPSATTAGVPSTASPAPTPTPASKSYNEICGVVLGPGDGAPLAVASQLRLLWIAPDSRSTPTPTATSPASPGPVGAMVGGCAQEAHPEPGNPEAWYEEGICKGGEICSVGIVAPGYQPALVISEHASGVAVGLIQRGLLLGATPREPIGLGDVYLLATTRGTVALVRRYEGYRYTLLPPRLTWLWAMIMEDHQLWMWPESLQKGADGPRFTFVSGAGAVLGAGGCDKQQCWINIYGSPHRTRSATLVSYEMIATYAPPATTN